MLAAELFSLPVARAETIWPQDKTSAQEDKAQTPAGTATTGEDEVQAVDVNALDWSQLNVDAYVLLRGIAPKPSAATLDAGDSMAWSSKDKPNGASDGSAKQKLTPFWDKRVGADMTVAHKPTTMSELLADKASGVNPQQSSGSAWATATAPGAGPIWDKTAVEARVDPSQDQSKLGTSISKHVPLTEHTSLTLSNGADVIQPDIVTGSAALPGPPAIATPNSRQNSATAIPAPASPPARGSRAAMTNGCARSAPSSSLAAASRCPDRSAAGHDQQGHQRRL